MTEWWSELSTDQKLTALKIVSPVVLLLAGGCGYLLARWVEKRGLHENLRALETKMEIVAKLKEQPDWATRLLLPDLQRVFGDLDAIESVPVEAKRLVRCRVSAKRRYVRAEGITEPVGDILLNFSSGDLPASETILDIEVSLNVNITNRVSSDGIADIFLETETSDLFSEAPARGHVESANRVVFRGVRIADVSRNTQFRITNIRANASMVGNMTTGDHPLEPPTEILAFVNVETTRSRALTVEMVGQLLAVGRIYLGFVSDIRNLDNSETAAFRNWEAIQSSNWSDVRNSFFVNIRESFVDSFEARQDTKADIGSRFMIKFFNVPAGVEVLVATRATPDREGCPTAVLVGGAGPDGAAGILSRINSKDQPPFTSARLPLRFLEVHEGYTFAVWEWIGRRFSRTDSTREIQLGVVLAAPRDGRLGHGSMQAAVTAAPTSVIVEADAQAPVPRFIDLSGSPKTVFSLLPRR